MPSKSKAKLAASKPNESSNNGGPQPNDPPLTDKAKLPINNDSTFSKAQQSPHDTPQPNPLSSSTLPSQIDSEVLPAPTVNRKKQKRRLKEAAKKATLQSLHSGSDAAPELSTSHGMYNGSPYPPPGSFGLGEDEEAYYHDDTRRGYSAGANSYQYTSNGYPNHNYIIQEPTGVANKKKKKKEGSNEVGAYPVDPHIHIRDRAFNEDSRASFSTHNDTDPTNLVGRSDREKRDRIWNTSTTEERERIKEFWLGLGEAERRGLVRIEKEAVLKKMKEQQKHSCSCTVCGRKRTAIEEELEVLYDAYYEELETFANHQHFGLDSSSIPPPRRYPRSRSALPPGQNYQTRDGGQIGELEDEEDEASEEEEDEGISEDDLEPAMSPSGGVFNFGNSLTAQGGILTVADDLLKNDGKKFIEMMEQLAERRMQREEESRMVATGMGHPSMRHNPAEEEIDDDYDEEAEDDDYSEEEDEFDDDEMEAMSEEQRMEEGRRMFQIFAARMFEQRVLNAYRQKVAEERQKKLIEELAEDEQLDAQREAKKAKEAQKKKDKRQKQKQAKEEERAKKEAERAAEEALLKASEEKKAEEQRQKREEQRKRKDAEKRALEDERRRREEEKQRQLRERREQQAEVERKQRELKEKEKKKREEVKKKEREDREAKEKAKRDQEVAAQKPHPPKAPSEDNAKERTQKHEPTVIEAAAATKLVFPANSTIPAQTTTSLQPSYSTSTHVSPRLPIATPVLPKPPTPGRIRQRSLQDSRVASPRPSQPVSSTTASPAASSDRSSAIASANTKKDGHGAPGQPLSQTSHLSPVHAPPGIPLLPPAFSAQNHPPNQEYARHPDPSTSTMPATAATSMPPYAVPHAVGSHTYRSPNPPFPPGIKVPRHIPPGQLNNVGSTINYGFEVAQANPIPSSHARVAPSHEPSYPQSHSRNQSNSSNISPHDSSHRPAPIQRPSSAAPPQNIENFRASGGDIDDLSSHLGSSALLDDTDDAPGSGIEDLRRGSIPVGSPAAIRQGTFAAGPGFGSVGPNPRRENDHQPNSKMWSNVPAAFGSSARAAQPFPAAPGFGRASNGTTPGSIPTAPWPGASRAVRVRILVCTICHSLSQYSPQGQGWQRAEQVLGEVQALMPRNEGTVSMMDMLHICDTEGSAQNGGGHFEFQSHEKVGFLLRYHPDGDGNMYVRPGPPPGDIGSPVGGQGGASNFSHLGGQEAFQQSVGFPSTAGL